MKTLHLAIFVVSLAGLLWIQDRTTQADSVDNISIQNIQVFPTTVKAGEMFVVNATLVNDSPYTVYVEHGACEAPFSVAFDSHVHVIENDVTCTTQMVLQKLDPGQGIAATSPYIDQAFKAQEGGKSVANATFSYSKWNPATKSNIENTVSRSFSFTIYSNKSADDLGPVIAVNMDRLSYAQIDMPTIKIIGPPSSIMNLTITDSSGEERLADIITTDGAGFATYSFGLASYTPGTYHVTISKGDIESEVEFGVGLSLDCIPTNLLTTKDLYHPGDFIILFGKTGPDCLLQLSMTDPNGTQTRSEQTISDKQGRFAAFNFNIPLAGPTGTWTLEAQSESYHISTKIAVQSRVSSPLEQFKSGIAPEDVACQEGLRLIIKAEDGSPACVSDQTARVLITRGWAANIVNHGTPLKPAGHMVPPYENATGMTFQPLVPPPIPPPPPGNLPINYSALEYAKIPNWNAKFECEKYPGGSIQITGTISNALNFSALVTDPKGVIHEIAPVKLNNTQMQVRFSAPLYYPDGNYVTAFKVVNGSDTSNVNYFCEGSIIENGTISPALHPVPP